MQEINIERFELGPLTVNCYVIYSAGSKECIVVDPGWPSSELESFLFNQDLKPAYIILTHGHFDHTSGVRRLKSLYECPLMIHKEDSNMLGNENLTAALFGLSADPSPPADSYISDGDTISISNIKIEITHTPGHSPGSICLIIKGHKTIICGDTLFAGSIGRTDLPGGDYSTLIYSIKNKILIFDNDVKVLPGHGPATTVGRERAFNPFLN